MSNSHREIDLSLKQVKILKRIKRKGKIPTKEIEKYRLGKYKFLIYYKLIELDSYDLSIYHINLRGESYLRYRKKDKIRFLVPIIISVIALAISIAALLKP